MYLLRSSPTFAAYTHCACGRRQPASLEDRLQPRVSIHSFIRNSGTGTSEYTPNFPVLKISTSLWCRAKTPIHQQDLASCLVLCWAARTYAESSLSLYYDGAKTMQASLTVGRYLGMHGTNKHQQQSSSKMRRHASCTSHPHLQTIDGRPSTSASVRPIDASNKEGHDDLLDVGEDTMTPAKGPGLRYLLRFT